MRKVIYVSGPITDKAKYLEYENCLHARTVAIMIEQCGGATHVPHFRAMCGMYEVLGRDDVLANDCEIVRRCDAIIMIGAWQGSGGCLLELKAAREAGIKVFMTMGELRDWLKTTPASPPDTS